MTTSLCRLCGVNPPSSKKSYGGRCVQCVSALGYSKGKTCPDCGKPIDNDSTRCNLCALRARALPRITSTCEMCGKVYKHRHQELGRFCSKACHRKWFGRAMGERKQARTPPRPRTTCKACGKEFVIASNRIDPKFCTQACYNNWYKGVNHSAFDPTLDRAYPITWGNALRWAIRARDGYTCQLCGLYARREGKRLCVHHIDYDKHNCDPSNLISLCSPCHGKTNVMRAFWTAFFRAKIIVLQALKS